MEQAKPRKKPRFKYTLRDDIKKSSAYPFITSFDPLADAQTSAEFRKKSLAKGQPNVCAVCGRRKGGDYDGSKVSLDCAHIESMYTGGITSQDNMLFLCRKRGKAVSGIPQGHHGDYDTGLISLKAITEQKRHWIELGEKELRTKNTPGYVKLTPQDIKETLLSDEIEPKLKARREAEESGEGSQFFIRQKEFLKVIPELKEVARLIRLRHFRQIDGRRDQRDNPHPLLLEIQEKYHFPEGSQGGVLLEFLRAHVQRRANRIYGIAAASEILGKLEEHLLKDGEYVYPPLMPLYYYERAYVEKLQGNRDEANRYFELSAAVRGALPVERLVARAALQILAQPVLDEAAYSKAVEYIDGLLGELEALKHPFANRMTINLKVYKFKYSLLMRPVEETGRILDDLLADYSVLDSSNGWTTETRFTICALEGMYALAKAREELCPGGNKAEGQKDTLEGLRLLARSIMPAINAAHQSLEGIQDNVAMFNRGVTMLGAMNYEKLISAELQPKFEKCHDLSSYFDTAHEPLPPFEVTVTFGNSGAAASLGTKKGRPTVKSPTSAAK